MQPRTRLPFAGMDMGLSVWLQRRLFPQQPQRLFQLASASGNCCDAGAGCAVNVLFLGWDGVLSKPVLPKVRGGYAATT